MPFISTKTNVEISTEKEQIIKSRLGEAISLVGKSEGWLMLEFSDNCKMYFKGESSSPMAFLDVSIFGNASKSACENFTREACRIMSEELGISPDKVYVKYEFSTEWGWNNMNF